MTTIPILQTARLVLRPLAVTDAESLFPAFADAATMRFMETPPHRTLAATQAHLARMLTPAACWWAILPQTAAQVIGFVGYLGNAGTPGMGYLLHAAYWRQGLMSEAVGAALDYGFGHAPGLNLDRVELWINDGNLASQRLAEKVGFVRQGQFRMRYPHETTPHDKVVYGLFRYAWQAQPGRGAVQPKACYGVQPILAVRDVQATAAYYCEQLGFTLEFLYGDPPTHGAVAWHDWTTEGAILQLSHQPNTRGGQKETALFFFVGPVIDDLYANCQRRGLTIVRPLANQPWGMREFTLEDCNGYLLRFGTAL